MKQSELEKLLRSYMEAKMIPFHMPGHKRNIKEYSILNDINKYDITEIADFDNYHHPTGILKEEFEYAARVYGSEESIYLVNGCSCGVLAAISGTFNRGDRILMARNCHKAVYNGVFMEELRPLYMYPELDEKTGIYKQIQADMVEMLLKRDSTIKGIILTSPTYEGIVSDIAGIVEKAHEYGVPVIVDEAHGAHFEYSCDFPRSAISCGADIVIEGLHKTLPSLTQTAIIHLNGKLINKERVRRYISIYQTTSPSYLLMSSISSCIRTAKEEKENWKKYYDKLSELRKKCDTLKHLKLLCRNSFDMYDYDNSKIVIMTSGTNMSGSTLARLLRDNHKIETEMVSLKYIILMTSVCDDFNNYDILYNALKEADAMCENEASQAIFSNDISEQAFTPYEAAESFQSTLHLESAAGFVSADYVMAYPPGMPLIVPGERIGEELPEKIKAYLKNNIEIIGLHGENQDMINVVEEPKCQK